MHPRPLGLVTLMLLFLAVGERCLLSWDEGAHEVIDAIAFDRLNPQARQAVEEASREMSQPVRAYDAVTLGTWLDDLRDSALALPGHGLFSTWHYIDLGIEPGDPEPSLQPGGDNEYNGNVVQALKRALVVLKGGTDPYIQTRAMACAMTMHLVGDIHQPLHAATHYFYTTGGWRHHDAGGNKEYVDNGPGGEEHFSLHRFWDSAWRASFDSTTGLVVIDPRYDDNPAAARALGKSLGRTSPPAGENLEPDFDGWALESNRLARDFVYRQITATESKKYCRLSSGYVARSNALARARLVLAGYRLAVLLNETLGAASPVQPPPSYPPGPAGRPYDSGN